MPQKSAIRKIYSKDHKSVTDEFNEFFASIGENTTKKIEEMAVKENYDLQQNAFHPKDH